MKCFYHNERENEYICSSCGKPLCSECAININGKPVCRDCNAYIRYNNNRTNKDSINGFLFFIYLFLPGLRHMYIGLMKRGLQFLSLFFMGFVLAATLDLPEFFVPLMLIVWFYSAFDSYNYRKIKENGGNISDDPIFNEFGINEITMFFKKSRMVSGIFIIILGFYLLLRQLRDYIWKYNIPQIVFDSLNIAFKSIIPILFIIGGIYLIVKVPKKMEDEK